MNRALLSMTVGALSLIAGAASAQSFDGKSIRYQFRYPDLTTVLTTQNAVVGPLIEFVDTNHFFTVDLSGTSIVITDTYGGQNLSAAFNGIVLSDTTNNLASISGVTFTGGGSAGESPILTFDADNIYFNFANITQITTPGTQYRYNVAFASGAVPEPSTWALMLVGLGAVGYGMRRRQAMQISYAA